MDIHRAQRNLLLIDEDENFIDSVAKDDDGVPKKTLAGTQVPDLELSSDEESTQENVVVSPEREVEPDIFINTQIQGKLDDIDHERAMKAKLGKFSHSPLKSPKKKSSQPLVNRVAKRSTKRVTKKTDGCPKPRAHNLLKQLSGKYGKVKDMIKSIDKDIAVSGKKGSTLQRYDTYNAEEWEIIKVRLLEKFPRSDSEEFKVVYEHLYGNEYGHHTLWSASQAGPSRLVSEIGREENERIDAERRNEFDTPSLNILSLSQVLEDNTVVESSSQGSIEPEHQGKTEDIEAAAEPTTIISDIEGSSDSEDLIITQVSPAKKDEVDEDIIITQVSPVKKDEDDEDLIITQASPVKTSGFVNADDLIIPDSQGESGTPIEISGDDFIMDNIPDLRKDNNGGDAVTYFQTPGTSPQRDLIDISTESFNVVKSLISPLKQESMTQASVQVPATRYATMTSIVTSASTQGGSSRNVLRCHLPQSVYRESFEAIKNQILNDTNDTDIVISDSEDEAANDSKPVYFELAPDNVQINETQHELHCSQLTFSQSMKELREKSRELGLKPSRQKSQLVESIEFATSKNFTNKHEIFDHLSELIRQSHLLEKIYRFQPLTFHELFNELVDLDKFTEYLDETTIREWADQNGVIIRNP
ncbi:hypothetical protein KAFR_0H02210 [Kazachstania africana CBS 2517]|uniref:Structure-specific endonuclease subunit SLX4 n=1 Tax=Kazachstania africana (strain ATCC 22294 / BCRC 22015 / CBS 2517 / CECT 1963 / NBRC 1671 / NRRL Y-8276) TaxID=1071382 RepID=H2AZ74_KAZAF|nr:hypothetical protein KAFR_0H02210 [Kazachstania africana CBS 2517]CCF59630.1 hypothetical protein KAFR_0H02210 [Kazachstania africana CBS 2517]